MSDNLRILHLRAGDFYGGPERQLHMHARLAMKAGCDITIASFTEKGKSPEFLKVMVKDNVRTCLFKVRNAYDLSAIAKLRKYLRENKIHILCTHDYRTQFIGFWAVRNTGSRWMAFSRGWTSENLKIILYNLLDKMILRFADHLVAVSHSQKQKLKKWLVPGDKISVVHNAINPENFLHIEKTDMKKEFGFPDDSLVYISGGRFSKEKGMTYLVQAAIKAISRNARLRFVLFGDGPDLASIREAISQSGNDDKILCPGFRSNFISYLKGSDFFINPSLSEGLPNVVLEAMATGIPILATSVGGVPEIISHQKNGYLVPPGNVDSLATGIIFLSSEEDRVREYAMKARKSIDARFSFEKQNEKLISLYKKLL